MVTFNTQCWFCSARLDADPTKGMAVFDEIREKGWGMQPLRCPEHLDSELVEEIPGCGGTPSEKVIRNSSNWYSGAGKAKHLAPARIVTRARAEDDSTKPKKKW